jgi:hypothetical protein
MLRYVFDKGCFGGGLETPQHPLTGIGRKIKLTLKHFALLLTDRNPID